MDQRLILPLLFFLCSLKTMATTYHVSPSGNNANSGLSPAAAWVTLQHAADVAIAGDSVIVHDGSYQGFAAMDNSGTAGSPIVFSGWGNNVLIDQPCSYNNLDGINVENVSWVVIEGFQVNGMPRTGIRTALTDHVTFRHNICANNGTWGILTGFAEHCIIEHNACSGSIDEHGIYFSNSADDPIIRYNHCFDNNANGIHMNGDASLGGDGVIGNAQVYGNIIHGNGNAGGSGINCDGVINSVIYNNLLYDNHASGISLYQIDGGAPSTGNKVFNNTIVNASDARWCVNITELCTNNQVLNNILINQHPWRGSIVIAADALTGFVSDFNLLVESLSPDGDATIYDLAGWQGLGYDLNSQVVDPMPVLFVSPGTGDLHAIDGSAQMVDAGTSAVSPVVSDDLSGAPRPQGAAYDIGCYEAGIATATSATTAPAGIVVVMGDRLIVNDAPRGSVLSIEDAMGRTIASVEVTGYHTTTLRCPVICIASLRDAQGSLLDVLKIAALQ